MNCFVPQSMPELHSRILPYPPFWMQFPASKLFLALMISLGIIVRSKVDVERNSREFTQLCCFCDCESFPRRKRTKKPIKIFRSRTIPRVSNVITTHCFLEACFCDVNVLQDVNPLTLPHNPLFPWNASKMNNELLGIGPCNSL